MEGLIEDEKLVLVSQEETEFHILQSVAEGSKLIETMISNDRDETRFVLKAKTTALAKVVEFLEYFSHTPLTKILRPVPFDLSESLPRWYVRFIQSYAPLQEDNLDEKEIQEKHTESAAKIIELINCANYMDIPMLMELGCAHIASYMRRIRRLHPEHENIMLRILQMDMPLTEKERKYITKDTAWAEPNYDPREDDFSDLNLDD